MKRFISLLNIVLVLGLLLAGCSGKTKTVTICKINTDGTDKDGKKVGELTLTPETKEGRLPIKYIKYGYVDGPRSLAVTKDGKTIYLVPEGANKGDRKENKEGVKDGEKKKISSWIFKIVLDAKTGRIDKVQRSSYYFEQASPADIALGKDGKNAYITVETKDPKKYGLYRINLEKAFEEITAGQEKSFPLKGPVSEFAGAIELKGLDPTKELKDKDCVHLRGAVLVRSTAKTDVLYVADAKGNQIWQLEYKNSNGEMKLDKKDVIIEQSDLKESDRPLFKDLFGIALDPIQTGNVNLLYLTTHPRHDASPRAPGKVLLVNTLTREVKELSDAWYGVDITTVNRNGTRWIFALAEGKERNKTSGEIISIRLKQAQGNKFEVETIRKIQGFYACHSIAFPSGAKRGFIAQVGDNYLYSFSMEDLWKILDEMTKPTATTPTPTLTPTPTVPPPTSTPKPTAPPQPTYLNMNLGEEPPTVDPALAIETSSVQCDELLFLGLTDYDDETSEVIPELAESWKVSSDGLKWTFEMRKDVWWVKYDPASGKAEKKRPVTAHDVEYGVKRSLDPATGSDYAYLLYIIENGEVVNTGESTDLDSVGVRALDDYTIEFTLEEPAAYFPGIAGMWMARPVPKEAIEEYGDKWTEPENIWTNGPYMMDGIWEHDIKMVMVKNPEHPDAADVQIDKINLFMVTEDSKALAMYENGELDVTNVPSGDVLDSIIAAPGIMRGAPTPTASTSPSRR